MSETTETAVATLTVTERAALVMESGKAEQALSELANSTKGIVTITNKDGRAECHAAYMTAKDARVTVEKAGKQARDDANAFSKAVIAEEQRLVGIIAPEEMRLKKLRDEYDEAEKAAKEAREKAEKARVDGIKARIAAMSNRVVEAASTNKTAAEVTEMIASLRDTDIDDSFAEFFGDAMEVRGDTLVKLVGIRDQKAEAEEQAARLAEERRQQEEQRQAEEKRQAEERARLDAERAEFERQRREFEAQQAEARRQQEEARQRQERLEAEAAEQRKREAEAEKAVEEPAQQPEATVCDEQIAESETQPALTVVSETQAEQQPANDHAETKSVRADIDAILDRMNEQQLVVVFEYLKPAAELLAA